MSGCDCGSKFVEQHLEFVVAATEKLRAVGAYGPYATLWHAPDCPNRRLGDDTDE